MDTYKIWESTGQDGPLVATAIHDGHEIREDVDEIIALSESERLREEDPYSGGWTTVGDRRITAFRSRFEIDLNRPRENAVYIKPEDAWGLDVWKEKPSSDSIALSLAEYDAFYSEIREIFHGLEEEYRRFVVFDLHTYNHRREGPDGPPADPELNPEVNVGTGTMDRKRWAPVVDRFKDDLQKYDFLGRSLDVRENVKFKGGQFPRWIHQTFPESACTLSIEFKKFFMDEWSGEPDPEQLEQIRLALSSTVPGVMEELGKINSV